jgi:hypothetical protein
MLVLTTFESDKRCGLVDIGQTGLEGNTTIGREREATTFVIPQRPWDFFELPKHN